MKRRKPLRKKRRKRRRNYSSRCRSRKCRLGWIRKRCCAYSLSRGTARRGGSANSVMIWRWSERGRSGICTAIRGIRRERMRRRRRMIWRIGMKVGLSRTLGSGCIEGRDRDQRLREGGTKLREKEVLIPFSLYYSQTQPSHSEQTRQPQNYYGQGLQILYRSGRARQVRLVLDVSERWRQVHVQAFITTWVSAPSALRPFSLSLPFAPVLVPLSFFLYPFLHIDHPHQLCPQNPRTTRRRKSPHGQITPQNPHPRRFPRIRTSQAYWHTHPRH